MPRPSFFIDTSVASTRTTSFTSSPPTSPNRSSLDSDDTDLALPFPQPLPRSDFLTSDFHPSTYLTRIAQNRHQTLEDLRSELRTRSQALSQELLELVNSHYSDFLGLGTSLRGGEDRVQEVWGGLRAFEREVDGLKSVVTEREEEVKVMVAERRRIRDDMEKAREMIAWEGRLKRLEERLMVGEKKTRVNADDDSESEEEDNDDEDDDEVEDDDSSTGDAQFRKLSGRVQDYNLVEYLAEEIGVEHPFVLAQRQRITQCRSTILLDLSNGSRQTSDNSSARLKIMSLYSSMDAAKEAIDVLKTSLNR